MTTIRAVEKDSKDSYVSLMMILRHVGHLMATINRPCAGWLRESVRVDAVTGHLIDTLATHFQQLMA